MKRLLVLSLLAPATLIASPPTPADVGWMTGTWGIEKEGSWTEEVWSAPRSGSLLGFSRIGTAKGTNFFEFLRIGTDNDGTLTLWASPKGAPPTPFKLVRSGKQELVFENNHHDYPQRIRYAREGQYLTGAISMLDGSKAQSWRYKRAR